MAIGTTYQVDILYEIPGKQGAMTYHFNQLNAGPGSAVLDSKFCFDQVADQLAGFLSLILPDVLFMLGAYVRQATINTPVVYPYLGLFSSPIQGARGSGEILPEGLGPLMMLGPDVLSVSPRRQVNRKYLPVMLEADQADGAIASSLVLSIDSFANDISNSSNFGSDFETVTYSAAEEALLSTFTWPVDNIRTSDQIARLVRRRPRFQGRS